MYYSVSRIVILNYGQLVNRYNDKDLVVEVTFNIDKDSYELVRGYKPATFSLTKNGQSLEVLSAKKLNQEEIDKLLGINYILFKNIVAVASTYNKPFLSLSAGERRTLVETIFNIYVIALMLKEVKRRNVVNKTQQKINLATLDGLNANKIEAEKYVTDTSKLLEEFNITKAQDIAKYTAILTEQRAIIDKAEHNISIADAKSAELVNSIDETTALEHLLQCKQAQSNATNQLNDLIKELNGISELKFCPTCHKEITDEEKAKLEFEITEQMEYYGPIAHSYKEIEAAEQVLDEIRKNRKLYDLIQVKKQGEVNKISVAKNSLTNAEENLANANNRQFAIDVESYKQKLEQLCDRIQTTSNDIDTLDKKLKLDETLIEILGDDGLKTYFFKQLLPQLNKHVNDYLTKFGLEISLEFDDNLEATIQQGKYICEYMGFSTGERARIDMAILLAFFDISRNISNWSCNVLFVDELFDGGVDTNGIEQFISTMYNIVNEKIEGQLGIYIISHKLSNLEIDWNSVININKTNRFSELKVTK